MVLIAKALGPKMAVSPVTVIFARHKIQGSVAPSVRCSSKDESDAYFERCRPIPCLTKPFPAGDVGKSSVDIGLVYRGKEIAGGTVALRGLVSEVHHGSTASGTS